MADHTTFTRRIVALGLIGLIAMSLVLQGHRRPGPTLEPKQNDLVVPVDDADGSSGPDDLAVEQTPVPRRSESVLSPELWDAIRATIDEPTSKTDEMVRTVAGEPDEGQALDGPTPPGQLPTIALVEQEDGEEEQTQPEPRPRPEPAPPPPGPAPDVPSPRNGQFPVATPGPLPTVQLRADDEDVRRVLEVLASQGAVNISVAPNVTGRITLNLRDVAFDQALDIVLKQANLVARRDGNVISVFRADNAGFAGPLGRSLETRVFTLNHVRAADAAAMVRPFLSRDGGLSTSPPSGPPNATAQPDGGPADHEILVVRDRPEDLAQIEAIIRQVDVPPLQVLFEAIVLRVTHFDPRSPGVNISVLDNLERMPFSSGRRDGMAAVASGPQVFIPGTRFGLIGGGVAGLIRDIETIGDVEILASPRLLVVNKQRAELHLGERLGYHDTLAGIPHSPPSVKYANVGTILSLRPIVSADGLVRVEFHPERSIGFLDGRGVPQARTSELTTTMLVPDGVTVVVAGLIEDTAPETRSVGHSWFPSFGLFAKPCSSGVRKSELVVFLTPRIVTPQGISIAQASDPRPAAMPPNEPPSPPVPAVADSPGGQPPTEVASDGVVAARPSRKAESTAHPPTILRDRSGVRRPVVIMRSASDPAEAEVSGQPAKTTSEPRSGPGPKADDVSVAESLMTRGATRNTRLGTTPKRRDPSVVRADESAPPPPLVSQVTPGPRGYRLGDITRGLASRWRAAFSKDATAEPSKPNKTPANDVVRASSSAPATSASVPSRLPRIAAAPEWGNWHVAQPGEDFATIARDRYGSSLLGPALWAANRGLVPVADELRAGQSIVLPPAEVLDGTLSRGPDGWDAKRTRR
jgi:hypothetical protein